LIFLSTDFADFRRKKKCHAEHVEVRHFFTLYKNSDALRPAQSDRVFTKIKFVQPEESLMTHSAID